MKIKNQSGKKNNNKHASYMYNGVESLKATVLQTTSSDRTL